MKINCSLIKERWITLLLMWTFRPKVKVLSFRKTGSDRLGASIWLSFILFYPDNNGHKAFVTFKKKNQVELLLVFSKKCLCSLRGDHRGILLTPWIFLTQNGVVPMNQTQIVSFIIYLGFHWAARKQEPETVPYPNKAVQFSHLVGRLGNPGHQCSLSHFTDLSVWYLASWW